MKYNIYCSCVKRKTLPVPTSLNYDEFGNGENIANWIQAVNQERKTGQTVKALDLYGGELWSVFKNAYKLSNINDGYVISAGLGLVNLQTPIPSYSITFARQNAEKKYVKDSTKWWDGLIQSNSLSLNGVINASEDDIVHIIAVGKTYLKAIYNDLIKCKNNKNLWVVSTDCKQLREFPNHIIVTQQYKKNKKCNSITMNIRALYDIVASLCQTLNDARNVIGTNVPVTKPITPVTKPSKISDNAIKTIISTLLCKDTKLCASYFKKCKKHKIVDDGDQKRFKQLFNDVVTI